MAGGDLAATTACLVCLYDHRELTMARRVREGTESDDYVCAKGHEFGNDWPMPAGQPQWPPPDEVLEFLRQPRRS